MAHQPVDHDAYHGIDDSVYQNGAQPFSTFESSFAYPGDQYPAHDAATNGGTWAVNAGNLVHNPQALSRGHSNSPVWSAQQQHRPQSSNSTHTPIHQAGPYAAPNAYNAFQPSYQFQQQYDPSLLGAQPYQGYARPETHTIAPQSLQHEQPLAARPAAFNAPPTVDQKALSDAIPPSNTAGIFQIVNFDQLVRATNSERMSSFATIGRKAQEWAINRAALPAYAPRKSRNELRAAAGNDPSLLSKISGSRKSKSKLRTSKTVTLVNGKPVPTPASEASSDESESETSDSDVDDSPLPAKRPELPREAIEYDTIQAVWRSKRKTVDANDVRKGLVAFWDIVKTVRDRWKADTAAVTQAEEKGAKGELPFLKQRVKDQRDLVEVAFKTALKHGNRTILETLSENASLIFLCYQFLLDRLKADDINGSLARAVLEVMVIFNTITEQKLEKTNLSKVLPRIIKNGDAKTQFYAKQITTKAAANKGSVSAMKAAAADAKASEAAGVKRPGGALNGTAAKKVATGAAKPAAVKTEPATGTAKKRLLSEDATKPAAKKVATTAEVKPKPASKLTSGLFAGLQSAAKKPGTSVKNASGAPVVSKPAPAPAPAKPAFSLADAMKSIAKPKEEKPVVKEEKEVIDETPEQKARRLRREARGPLRVHWKTNEELVSIRLFTHDPDEELGHNSSQTRDVADLQNEGRMFKQQHNSMMDLDDDDDDALTPAKEIKMVEWSEPQLTDFSDVKDFNRDGTYARFAGGALQPDSPETRAREAYEADTLMVFYSQPEDIPANPREPADAISGDVPKEVVSFGNPETKFSTRAREVRSLQKSIANGISSHAAPQAPIDFDKLRNALSSGTAPVQAPQPMPDLMSILAKLQPGAQPAPQMQFPAPNQAWPGPFGLQPAPQSGQPDIAAILAQLKGNQQPAMPAPPPPPPAMPGFGAAGMDPGFLAFIAQQQAAEAAKAQTQSSGLYENPDRKRWRDAQDTK